MQLGELAVIEMAHNSRSSARAIFAMGGLAEDQSHRLIDPRQAMQLQVRAGNSLVAWRLLASPVDGDCRVDRGRRCGNMRP